ncbi:MAG: helix-turn-helix domain-containing protein [Alloprevotella sp.]|nr:helix-turn-helix domain-containing protein [Alloprevotella sp.]
MDGMFRASVSQHLFDVGDHLLGVRGGRIALHLCAVAGDEELGEVPQEAAFLLRTSDLSMAQIADRLHFADQASFTKFFQRLRGTAPGEYRRQPI